MLKEKLLPDQLRYFLSEILNFQLCEEFNDVIYTEEGDEFYANSENDKFDLSTLGGIIQYSNHIAREDGKWKAQYAIRQAIGIN